MPSGSSWATAASSSSGLRAVTTTEAPRSTSSWASASPMPRVAPVRTATRPVKSDAMRQSLPGGFRAAHTHRRWMKLWRRWRQHACVTSIQIKDVPPETHAVLRRRAALARQSLQEYLRARLIEEATRPTVNEVLARLEGRAGGPAPFVETVSAVRDDRDR